MSWNKSPQISINGSSNQNLPFDTVINCMIHREIGKREQKYVSNGFPSTPNQAQIRFLMGQKLIIKTL